MVFLVYGALDKKIYIDGVYELLEEAESQQNLLNGDVKYDIVNIPYWAAQKKVEMCYSEEDCDIEEEDYYKLLDEVKKLNIIVEKQKELIDFMYNYITKMNYGIIGLLGMTVVSIAYVCY